MYHIENMIFTYDVKYNMYEYFFSLQKIYSE